MNNDRNVRDTEMRELPTRRQTMEHGEIDQGHMHQDEKQQQGERIRSQTGAGE
jgi:hypothetical protein